MADETISEKLAREAEESEEVREKMERGEIARPPMYRKRTATKFEDRLRELSEQAESEPWQIRPYVGYESVAGDRLKGYQIVRVSDDELSYKRLATTTPTEDRWLPASEANVNLMTFQRNSAEATAEAIAALRQTAWNERDGRCWCPESAELTGAHVARCVRARAALAALDQEVQR